MALLMFFQSLPLRTLPGVLITLILVTGGLKSYQACAWRWYLFFSLLVFLLEVLLTGEEFSSFGVKSDRGFLIELWWGSRLEEAYELAMVEWAGWLPYRQRWSISRKINGSCRLAFASASIVFSTKSSQLLCSRPRYSIWAFIDSLRPLQKN